VGDVVLGSAVARGARDEEAGSSAHLSRLAAHARR
jgi:hypothetical protein